MTPLAYTLLGLCIVIVVGVMAEAFARLAEQHAATEAQLPKSWSCSSVAWGAMIQSDFNVREHL